MSGHLGKEAARPIGSLAHTARLMLDKVWMPHVPEQTGKFPWKPPCPLYSVNCLRGYILEKNISRDSEKPEVKGQ